jgi:hypothetical protein
MQSISGNNFGLQNPWTVSHQKKNAMIQGWKATEDHQSLNVEKRLQQKLAFRWHCPPSKKNDPDPRISYWFDAQH